MHMTYPGYLRSGFNSENYSVQMMKQLIIAGTWCLRKENKVYVIIAYIVQKKWQHASNKIQSKNLSIKR